MPQTHGYFLACWLAGIDPGDIVCRDNNERHAMLQTYLKAEMCFQYAQSILKKQGKLL